MAEALKTVLERLYRSQDLPDQSQPVSRCDQCGDYLPHDCEWCHDAGWTRRGGLRGTPDFGKLDHCPECANETDDERQVKAIKARMERAGFYGIEAKRFDDFHPASQPTQAGKESAAIALARVTDWSHESGPAFLVLAGGAGVGKTHLEQAACRRLVERGAGVKYVVWEDFAHHARDSFERVHAYIDALRETRFLVIDEVFAARDNRDYLSDTLRDLMGHRHVFDKPTMIAGNLTDDENPNFWKDTFGERFVDRMRDKTTFQMVDLWACESLRPALDRAT